MTTTVPQVITTKSGAFVVTEYALPAVKPQPPASAAPRVHSAGSRILTTSRLHRRTTTVPYIRLAGEWLRKAGIEPGARLTVTVTPQGAAEAGRITITAGDKTP